MWLRSRGRRLNPAPHRAKNARASRALRWPSAGAWTGASRAPSTIDATRRPTFWSRATSALAAIGATTPTSASRRRRPRLPSPSATAKCGAAAPTARRDRSVSVAASGVRALALVTRGRTSSSCFRCASLTQGRSILFRKCDGGDWVNECSSGHTLKPGGSVLRPFAPALTHLPFSRCHACANAREHRPGETAPVSADVSAPCRFGCG